MKSLLLSLVCLPALFLPQCKRATAPAPAPAADTPASAPAPAPGEAPGLLDAYRELKGKAEGHKAASEIATLGKYLLMWSLDHEGEFPPDLDALAGKADRYGIDGKWLEGLKPGMLEYRGKGLANFDDGNLVLVRYRAAGQPGDTEVRLLVNGSSRMVPADTPMPPNP